MQPILNARDTERFWSKVAKTQTCWKWTGRLDANGYGCFHASIGGRKGNHRPHRVSLMLAGVEIPDDLVVDHICRVRDCVNPEHLRVVTNAENVLAGIGVTAVNARKTHCVNGHEFTDENTHIRPMGWRECIECKRAESRRAYWRRAAKASGSAS